MKMAMKNVCLIVSMIYISEIYLSLNPAKTHILRLLCRIKIKFDVVRMMIKIPIGNGINIVAEQGIDSSFPREIYIGLVNDNDMWLQDLAIVRQAYKLSDGENDGVDYIDGKYQVLVYADKDNEDYTHKFDIDEAEYSSL